MMVILGSVLLSAVRRGMFVAFVDPKTPAGARFCSAKTVTADPSINGI